MKSISRASAQFWRALAVASVTLPLHAQFDATFIVFSGFSNDADDWTAVDRDPGTGAFLRVHSTPDQLFVSGGRYIQASPGDGLLYFRAPAKFLGDKSTAFGGTLSFIGGQFGQSVGTDYPWDVILSDGTTTLCSKIRDVPGPYMVGNLQWAYREVLLLPETGGWTNLATGDSATRPQMLAVLSSLAVLDIRGGFDPKAAETNALNGILLTAGCPAASIRQSSTNQVEISWRSQPDWFYRVESRSSLHDGAWVRITDILLGTGGEMHVPDTVALGQAQQFYRVCTIQ